MAKGSVRKKGKKWYYRFYVENESGNLVQKEYAGTESKSETEKMLRKAMEEYESRNFIARTENITLGGLLDKWVEEELKPGSLSNGTVMAYQSAIRRIKQHPIGNRRLKSITADHLQEYIDLLSFGGTNADGAEEKPVSKNYMLQFSAVLRGAFRFAVFPKRYITFNPMQYVRMRVKKEDAGLFPQKEEENGAVSTITHKQYLQIRDFLKNENNPAVLPIQTAYYTGLRIGEACGLSWQDINLEEQYLTVRRSMRYNGIRHKIEVGATKRSKIRTVDFCDTLAGILREAQKEQRKQRLRQGERYQKNCYHAITEKGRTYYEVYALPMSEEQEGYEEIPFICQRADGAFLPPTAVSCTCRKIAKSIKGLEHFHFHLLRHSYTSNLLAGGASPKDVQELLGHSDVSTTMNIYAHATRQAKRECARLLDCMESGA